MTSQNTKIRTPLVVAPHQLIEASLDAPRVVLCQVLADGPPPVLGELCPQCVDGPAWSSAHRPSSAEPYGGQVGGLSVEADVGASLVVAADELGEAPLDACRLVLGEVLADGAALGAGELDP